MGSHEPIFTGLGHIHFYCVSIFWAEADGHVDDSSYFCHQLMEYDSYNYGIVTKQGR